MEPIVLIIIIVVIAILGTFLTYYLAKLRCEMRFQQWQEAEKQNGEPRLRKPARQQLLRVEQYWEASS